MPRETEEIFPESPGGELTERAESDSAPVVSDTAEPTDKAKAPVKAAPAQAEEDDEEEAPLPVDLEGLRKAAKAARGDGRKFRKQFKTALSERQKLEHELATMRGELQVYRQQTAPKPQTQARQEADPDEAFWQDGPGKFHEAREEKLRQEFSTRLIESDRRAMRRGSEDFDQAEAAFIAAAQTNQALAQEFRQSDDPVGYAYKRGKEILKFQELGATSIDDLETKLREKLRAELLAEMQGGQAAAPAVATTRPAPARPPIPPKSNAGARGSGVGTQNAWSGPRPTDQVWRE